MLKKVMMTGAVAVVLLLGSGFLWLNWLFTATGAPSYYLEIKPGMSINAVSRVLNAAGILHNTQALKWRLRLTGKTLLLRDGLYVVSGEQTVDEIIDILNGKGKPRELKVVIPEGKRLKDIVRIIAEVGLSNSTDLEAAFKNKKLVPEAKTDNLEGFLFPATYLFPPEATAETIAETLVKRMRQELTPERSLAAQKLGLSVYQWVTLASIVQAEAGNSEEMPIIAGLFLNRLDINMPLQSDPTVAYGLGKNLPELNRGEGDFKVDTPYNSYTRRGLTLTPISNPGKDALLAVLNPVRMVNGKQAIYFVHGNDRRIHVNSTYADHLRDVEKYYR